MCLITTHSVRLPGIGICCTCLYGKLQPVRFIAFCKQIPYMAYVPDNLPQRLMELFGSSFSISSQQLLYPGGEQRFRSVEDRDEQQI